MESKYEGRNDRLTAFSNQNKTCQKVTTDTLITITKDVESVKPSLVKKTSVIISKSQTIIETIKTTADLVGKASAGALAGDDQSKSLQCECKSKTVNAESNDKSKENPIQSQKSKSKTPGQTHSNPIHTENNRKHIGPAQNISQEK